MRCRKVFDKDIADSIFGGQAVKSWHHVFGTSYGTSNNLKSFSIFIFSKEEDA